MPDYLEENIDRMSEITGEEREVGIKNAMDHLTRRHMKIMAGRGSTRVSAIAQKYKDYDSMITHLVCVESAFTVVAAEMMDPAAFKEFMFRVSAFGATYEKNLNSMDEEDDQCTK